MEAALDALEASNYVDTKRLGVFGHSYGGYAVNCVVVQSDRFAAAVSSTGMSNLVSAYLRDAGKHGNTGWFEDGQLGMGVAYASDPQKYVRNSPVFHLEQVRTPLLLIHGEEDASYPQAVEMFGGLRRAGKRVEFATYTGAGHAFGSYQTEQIRDFWTRMYAWFDVHLGR